jgi:uncharacterized membrane protein YhfC
MDKVVNNSPVSQFTVNMMGVEMLLCFALPIILLIWVILRYSKPKKGAVKVFFIGMGVFFLFAGVLEGPFRGIAKDFQHVPFLYALYGALLAGVFEEVGRYLGLKFINKRIPTKAATPETPFLYGLGHGGLEMILIGSLTMFSNFMFAMLINGGKVNEMLEKVPASSRSVLNRQVKQLMATTGWTISLSLMERLLALAVQIALSVVVWIIIMKRMRWFWLLLPIGLHAFIDFPAALTQVGTLNGAVEEVLLVAQTILVLTFTYWFWRQNRQVMTRTAKTA